MAGGAAACPRPWPRNHRHRCDRCCIRKACSPMLARTQVPRHVSCACSQHIIASTADVHSAAGPSPHSLAALLSITKPFDAGPRACRSCAGGGVRRSEMPSGRRRATACIEATLSADTDTSHPGSMYAPRRSASHARGGHPEPLAKMGVGITPQALVARKPSSRQPLARLGRCSSGAALGIALEHWRACHGQAMARRAHHPAAEETS